MSALAALRAAAPVRPGFALLLALLAGGLQALALAPQPQAVLQWLATLLLAALVWQAAPKRAALLGGLYGFGWMAGSVWWLYIAMHRYGGLPGWLSVLAVLALAAVLSLYLAGAMAAQARWRPASAWGRALGFAAWWLAAELARGSWFSGFPWAASGYAHVDGFLSRLAPWLGVYGIGLLAAWLAAWPCWALANWRQSAGALPRRLRALAVPLLALLAVLGGVRALPQDFSAPVGTLSVTLLQGNVPQDEKFDQSHVLDALGWHVGALMRADTDLVLAPETAIALLPEQLPEGWWERLTAHFAQGRTAALFGVPLGSLEQGYTNSVLGLVPGRPQPYRYDKAHLLPFGEFIPPGFRWFVDLMQMPLGDFARGPLNAPSLVLGPQRIAPSICYEDLFGEELATRFSDPASAPTLLANVSNLGWYDQSTAVPQHLQFSRLRALEFQRPMIRATNTGATVVIDHRGQVSAALPPYIDGTLVSRVEGRSGLTPYARWVSAWGLRPWWLLLLLAATVQIRRRKTASAAI